ncbi:hypothetical protein LEP1GSC079_0840 [Leptospira interrogans str. FPW1039]|uniref:Uncharacterized protein n=1 Tax=Leptospira interrogans str. FPW1039 TaxID=1193040 RepID=A0A0F6IKS1_LEPIR|nr:hypothetical protein LEP1GSC079_0840 [Leptospira interrogans str. FPW1039]
MASFLTSGLEKRENSYRPPMNLKTKYTEYLLLSPTQENFYSESLSEQIKPILIEVDN